MPHGAMLTQADLEIQTAPVFEATNDASGAGRGVPISQAYISPAGFYDEMFTHCLGPARYLLRMTPDQLASLRAEAERMLLHQGV